MMKHTLKFLVLVCLLSAAVRAPVVRGQTPNRVALVVHFGATTITRCVAFDEPEISGYDVLARSGLPFTAAFDAGSGAAICAIEDTGCPAETCLLCQAPLYWSYWRMDNANWVYSNLGSSNTKVRHGNVEGWSWGRGDPPPGVSYADICTPPTPTLTPAPPTATPTTPPPTATPLPMPEARFRFDANPVRDGTCTQVRWDTANAHSAFLNEEAVALSGNREVCPETDLQITLRVVNDYAEQSYVLVLGVVTVAATATPLVNPHAPAATAQPAATATPQPTETPRAASPDTAPVATFTPSPIPSATPTAMATPASNTPTAPAPSFTPTRSLDSTTREDSHNVVTAPLAAPPPGFDLPGYLIFGLVAAVLLIGLGWRGLRQR